MTPSEYSTREDIEAGLRVIGDIMVDMISLVVRFDGVAFERLLDTAVHARELYGKDTAPLLTHNMNVDNICEVQGWSSFAIAHDLAIMQYNGGPLGLDVFKWFQKELRPTLLARAKNPRESRFIECLMDRVLNMAMGRPVDPEAARCPEER